LFDENVLKFKLKNCNQVVLLVLKCFGKNSAYPLKGDSNFEITIFQILKLATNETSTLQ